MKLGRITFQDSATATEALLRECWRFRLSLIALRPEVTPEDDWLAFRAYFRPGVELITQRRADGELSAIFAWSLREVREDGRARVIIDADYGFVRPEERQRLVVAVAFARIWGSAALRGRTATVTLLGSGYPSGVMGFGRFARRIRGLADPDLEPWERRILAAYCAEHECVDAGRGILRMRTRPLERRREPRSARSRELLAWFEGQVPDWEEGRGLVYVVCFAPTAMLRASLRAVMLRATAGRRRPGE